MGMKEHIEEFYNVKAHAEKAGKEMEKVGYRYKIVEELKEEPEWTYVRFRLILDLDQPQMG